MIVDSLFYQLSSETSPLNPLMKLGEEIMTFPAGLDREVFVNSKDERFRKLQEEVYHRPGESSMLNREAEDELDKRFITKDDRSTTDGVYEMKIGHVRFFDRPEVRRLQSEVESLFGTQCQLLGDFIYPPGGFRTWHTNRYDVPKSKTSVWAIFFVFAEEEGASFFRFIHPDSGEMITAWDKRACANIFRVSRDPLIWHCIRAEDTTRWSVGFHLPDHWEEVVYDK